jgi:hypothetical protein
MVRDVYAGDDALPAHAPQRTAHYLIVADADPNVVARVAQQLAFANVSPSEFHMSVDADGVARIHATLVDVAAETCEFIRRKLDQLSTVREVAVE